MLSHLCAKAACSAPRNTSSRVLFHPAQIDAKISSMEQNIDSSSKGAADFRTTLSCELARRQARNPAYSLRAFARALGVSATTLSEALAGHRGLVPRTATQIAHRLGLAPDEHAAFLLSALGGVERRRPIVAGGKADPAYDDLDVDRFKMVADWYHFAILSLAKLAANAADPAWIAARLGISRAEALQAFERLQRLALIEVRGKKFRRTSGPLFVRGGAPSAAIRKFHRQNLDKAIDSLERDDVSVRDMSSMTMAINPRRMPDARKQVQKFRERMASLLEEDDATAVYTLAIQLFPVSNVEDPT